MPSRPLFQPASKTVGSTGIVEVTVGPMRAFERWRIKLATVQNTSTINQPQARLYRGSVSAGSFIGGTYSGRLDTTDLDLLLQSGELLVAQWTGADIGSTSTLTVDGERILPN